MSSCGLATTAHTPLLITTEISIFGMADIRKEFFASYLTIIKDNTY